MLTFHITDTVRQLKKDCKKHKVKGYSKCKNKKELVDFCHEKIKQQHINKLMMINKLSKIKSKKYNPIALVFKQELFMTKINNYLSKEPEYINCKYNIHHDKYKIRDSNTYPYAFLENSNYIKQYYLQMCMFSKKHMFNMEELSLMHKNNMFKIELHYGTCDRYFTYHFKSIKNSVKESYEKDLKDLKIHVKEYSYDFFNYRKRIIQIEKLIKELNNKFYEIKMKIITLERDIIDRKISNL